jgi:drug/metabolite transporter (DMT)-like permease
MAATVCYGFSANFAKRYLTGVAPMAVASGSLVSASLVLTIPALWLWPATSPSTGSWLALLGLALACTGLAYVIFYRLITNIGSANTIAVTFLIPAFGLAWGAMLLGESLTWAMTIGCAVILAGTALATGLLPRPART